MNDWKPLTTEARLKWQVEHTTLYFRDAKGQMGFGTYDLAQAMGIKVVEVKEIG